MFSQPKAIIRLIWPFASWKSTGKKGVVIEVGGVNYRVFLDRYTGWPGVIAGSLASDVATFIAKLCEIYGVPETIT